MTEPSSRLGADSARDRPVRQTDDRLCVGLTGGIGCGKSTVARLFEAHGAGIIDTDVIAHQLTRPGGPAIPLIFDAFGADYITATGTLNRAKLRQLIFADTDARRKLEGILHPMILARCKAQLDIHSSAPYFILVVPLLLENPAFLQLVQRVLLVNCTEENQITRTMQRSLLDEPEIRAIIAQQASVAERLARADDIIQNDASCDALTNQVDALHRYYSSMD